MLSTLSGVHLAHASSLVAHTQAGYHPGMLTKSRSLSYVALSHDFCMGLLLLVLPGFVHEALHGWILRTTFFVPQSLGLALLVRSSILLRFRLSPPQAHLYGLSYTWLAQSIILFGMAVRLGGEPLRVPAIYLGWAALAAYISSCYWRYESA